MMICEPKRGWRDVLIMQRRTKIDFAHAMRHIVECYPDAEVIRVVLDNLNTHKTASLYEAFPPEEARAIARKLEFHYTPSMAAGSTLPSLSWRCCRTCVCRNVSLMKKRCDARWRPMCVNATPKPSPSSGSSPLRMLDVSLLVFILAFQRDWLLGAQFRQRRGTAWSFCVHAPRNDPAGVGEVLVPGCGKAATTEPSL